MPRVLVFLSSTQKRDAEERYSITNRQLSKRPADRLATLARQAGRIGRWHLVIETNSGCSMDGRRPCWRSKVDRLSLSLPRVHAGLAVGGAHLAVATGVDHLVDEFFTWRWKQRPASDRSQRRQRLVFPKL